MGRGADPRRAEGGNRSFRAQDGYIDNAPSVQVLDKLPPDYGGAGAIVGPPLAGRTEEIPRLYYEVMDAQQIYSGL